MVYQMPCPSEQLLFVASSLGDDSQAQTEIAQWAQENGYLPPQNEQSYVIYEDGPKPVRGDSLSAARTPLLPVRYWTLKSCVGVRPDLRDLPPGAARPRREVVQAVLVGTLRPDRLVRRELERRCPDPHRLVPQAEQVHLDPPRPVVIERLVFPVSRSKSPPNSRLIRCSKFKLNAAVTPCRSL